MRIVTVFVTALFSSMLLAAEPTSQPAKPPAVGAEARPAEFKTLDKRDVRLAELRDKGPVVLIVLRGWVGYQCPLCTKQVADFVAHSKDLEKYAAQVILVYPGPA